jgi:hypothetical protein
MAAAVAAGHRPRSGAQLLMLFMVTIPHFATGRFSGHAPVHTPGTGVQLDRLYENTGMVRESPGRSCGELLSMGMTDNGVYWLKPDGYTMPFQAYCDMKSFGGGWQMCYTTKVPAGWLDPVFFAKIDRACGCVSSVLFTP